MRHKHVVSFLSSCPSLLVGVAEEAEWRGLQPFLVALLTVQMGLPLLLCEMVRQYFVILDLILKIVQLHQKSRMLVLEIHCSLWVGKNELKAAGVEGVHGEKSHCPRPAPWVF